MSRAHLLDTERITASCALGVRGDLRLRWIRFLPFFGRLPDCSPKDIKHAAIEVFVATAFSTMPVWFLPLLSPVFFNNPITSSQAIRSGELFLFSAGLVGPLMYIITKQYGESKSANSKSSFLNYVIYFPYGQWFVFISLAICFISSIAFFVLRNPLFNETQLSLLINYDGVIKFSWFTFIISTIVFFCATAYRNSIENVNRIAPNQEREFSRDWERNK